MRIPRLPVDRAEFVILYDNKKGNFICLRNALPLLLSLKNKYKMKKMDCGSNYTQETIRAHKERSKNDFMVMLIRL